MSEGKRPTPENVLKGFIENRYGSKVYEKYLEARKEGSFASAEEAVDFLEKKAKAVEGKLLPESRLRVHDERIESKVESLFEKYLKIEKALEDEQKDHKASRQSVSKLRGYAKFASARIVELAKSYGFDKDPEYMDDRHGKRLKQTYVVEAFNFISEKLVELAKAQGFDKKPEYIENKVIGKRLKPRYVAEVFTYIITQLEKPEEDVSGLKEKVEGLEKDNKRLDEELRDLQSANGELQLENTGLNAEKEDLETKLEIYKKFDPIILAFEDYSEGENK